MFVISSDYAKYLYFDKSQISCEGEKLVEFIWREVLRWLYTYKPSEKEVFKQIIRASNKNYPIYACIYFD